MGARLLKLLVPLLLLLLGAPARAVPVDNAVLGEPRVECGPHAIQVTFRTE